MYYYLYILVLVFKVFKRINQSNNMSFKYRNKNMCPYLMGDKETNDNDDGSSAQIILEEKTFWCFVC